MPLPTDISLLPLCLRPCTCPKNNSPSLPQLPAGSSLAPLQMEPLFLRSQRVVAYTKRLVSSCRSALIHPWYIQQYRQYMVGKGAWGCQH